jgi:hypothetical protein
MTSWSTGGRSNGIYGYHVQACNAGGCGPWSTAATITVLLVPAAPTSISIPASSSGPVAVNWTASAAATSYTLQHADYGVTGWSTIYSGSATGFTQQETVAGTWIYQVQACNVSGCSAFVVSGTGVTVTIPPASAPNLSVPANSNTGSYTVSWSAVGSAVSYTLQEQVNGGGWTTIQAAGTTSDALGGKGNATYGYRVQACNAGGCGPWSGTSNVVVTLIPASPTGLTATIEVTNLLGGRVMVKPAVSIAPLARTYAYQLSASWAASTGATSYTFQYCQSGGSCATRSGSTTSVSPFSVSGSQYTVSVQACNSSGCSAYSAPVTPTVVQD